MAEKNVDNYIINCEHEVLTTIINDPVNVEEAIVAIEQSDFIDDKNGKIFAAIVGVYSGNSKTINKNTIADFITNNNQCQFENWQAYLDEIVNSFAYNEDLTANLELIKNASIKRQLDTFCKRVVNTKLDYANYNDQMMDLQTQFMNIAQSKRGEKLTPMSNIAVKYLDKVNKLRDKKQEITGTPVGFSLIDKTTNGLQPGDMIILAARPGVGKTAIALNFANNAANWIKENMADDKDRVVIFSLEMGAEQLCQRLVTMNSRVDSTLLRSGRLSDNDWNAVQTAVDHIKSLPILIDDTSVSIADIQAKLKQLKSQYNIRLVIIDYLQLMKGPVTKGVQTNRQQEVSNISRMIKLLARSINSPIVALAQLSRAIEQRSGASGNAEPRLSDLRESGSLEQDADIVCFLHSLEDVQAEANAPVKAAGPKERADVIPIQFMIAKHRNGAVRNIPLTMNRKYGAFFDVNTSGWKEGK